MDISAWRPARERTWTARVPRRERPKPAAAQRAASLPSPAFLSSEHRVLPVKMDQHREAATAPKVCPRGSHPLQNCGLPQGSSIGQATASSQNTGTRSLRIRIFIYSHPFCPLILPHFSVRFHWFPGISQHSPSYAPRKICIGWRYFHEFQKNDLCSPFILLLLWSRIPGRFCKKNKGAGRPPLRLPMPTGTGA